MAKGQKRSNKEVRKPKKAGAESKTAYAASASSAPKKR
jgi:hypothetical protein